MPVLESGTTTSTIVLKRLAPASLVASIRAGSIFVNELAIGPIISNVNKWT
jgi:hypothetical protein